MKVFVDTSALLAILDEDDRVHSEAADCFRDLLGFATLVTHNYVLIECLAFARKRFGATAVERLTDKIFPVLETIWVDEQLHRVAVAAHRAARTSTSLVDEVSFEIMRREGIEVAFAFDADFEAQGFLRVTAQPRAEKGIRLREESAPYGSGPIQSSDLVSVAEIATRSGRPFNTVQSWRRRHRDFPEPAASLATGPIWSWPVVQRWIERRAAPRSESPSSRARSHATQRLATKAMKAVAG